MDCIYEKELNPIFETSNLMFLSNHEDAVLKEDIIKGFESYGINGESLYKKSGPIIKKYVKCFKKHKKEFKNENFFFDDLTLILHTIPAVMNNPQWLDETAKISESEFKKETLSSLCSASEQHLAESISSMPDLIALFEELQISDEIKWKLFLIIQKPAEYFPQLIEMIRENLPAYEKAYEEIKIPLTKLIDKFTKKDLLHIGPFIENNIEVKKIIPVLASPYLDLIFGHVENTYERYLGLFAVDFYEVLDSKKFNNEHLLLILKALGDKSKFEIMTSLKRTPKYNLEIAADLGLTPATTSHHMNVLLSSGIVYVEKRDGKVYYDINREKMKQFLVELEQILL